ncbi:MAG: hypothetical protein QG602_1512 [Verrucomicrobiota bacterium]|nr:hypothetical protein [Verrucomicrobiota bacterium]
MTGFYLGDINDNTAARAQGIDLNPEGVAAVQAATFGQFWHDSPINQIVRGFQRGAQMPDVGITDPMGGFAPAFGQEGGPPRDVPMLTPDEANKRFKLPGMQPFTADTPEAIAQGVFDEYRQKLQRDNVRNRGEGFGTGGVAQFGVGLLTSLLDPVNVASAFIPVIPEAKVAAWLASQSGVLGRATVRAGVGMASGAAGQALIEPLTFLSNVAEHEDYTMGNAAVNIAMGAAMGAVLHAGGGAIADRYRGVPSIVRTLDADTAEMAMRGSIAQTLDGRPVAVGDAIEAARVDRVSRETADRVQRLDELPKDSFAAAEAAKPATMPLPELRGQQYAPPSLMEFIGSRGGILDQGGDLAAIGADTHFVPGQGKIVRRNGVAMDYMREAAEEAGYLRPGSTIADLIDAIAEEVAGRKVFLPHEYAMAHERRLARLSDREAEQVAEYRAVLSEIAEDHGVTLRPSEIDHAVMMTMDGMHPEEAVRRATLGVDLEAIAPAVAGFNRDAIAAAQAVREMGNIPPENIAQTRVELEALQARAPKIEGDAAKELAEATAQVADMEKRLRVDLDNHPEGAAMQAHLDRVDAHVADENAIANAFPTISSIVCRNLGGRG